jgi:thioredoxin 1
VKVEISDKTFEKEVLHAKKPVMVMFWGSWCPVCKRMEPMLKEVNGDFEKLGVKIKKINIDRNPRKAAEYKIQGTPTFYLFNKEGNPVDIAMGAHSKKQLVDFVKRNIQGD